MTDYTDRATPEALTDAELTFGTDTFVDTVTGVAIQKLLLGRDAQGRLYGRTLIPTLAVGPRGADGADGEDGVGSSGGSVQIYFQGGFHMSSDVGNSILSGDVMAASNNVNVANATSAATGIWDVTLTNPVPSDIHVIGQMARLSNDLEIVGQVYAYMLSTTSVRVEIYSGNGNSLVNRDFYIQAIGPSV